MMGFVNQNFYKIVMNLSPAFFYFRGEKTNRLCQRFPVR